MKKTTRLISMLLLAVMFFAAGCGGDPGNSGNEEDTVLNITALTERENASRALSGKDALGREVKPTATSNDKLVGLFYVLWMGNEYENGNPEGTPYFEDIYDLSKMTLEEAYSPTNTPTPFVKMHFYAEPLFGYYNMRDRWVVERHVQMFIAADIDFLAVDSTNWSIYPMVLPILLDVLDEYRMMGYHVPKVMFMTNTESNVRVTQLYEFMYRDGKYRNLWFCDDDQGSNPERKPWVSMRADQRAYLPKEIRDTFYFKDSQWPNETFKDNGFPWIEFERPQRAHNGIVSVSVAQNAGLQMSNSVQYEQSPNDLDYYNMNWGRGYTSAAGENQKSKINEGANFQEQWDNAIALDPHIIMVTEWNEWAALKLSTTIPGISGNTVVYFDCATPEFSRDIEPIKGYYGDNFYMQLIQNIRRFKNTEGAGIVPAEKTIDINGDGSDWNSVTSGVADFAGQKERNFQNCVDSFRYVNKTKRNDITEIRIAEDEQNYYVLVTCDEAITVAQTEDRLWMNLWLRTSALPVSSTGYDYVLNRVRDAGTATIERLTAEGSDVAGQARMRVTDKYLQFEISKSVLSCGEDFLELKATDNVDLTVDIMDLYQNGDSAPYGRLNYRFVV